MGKHSNKWIGVFSEVIYESTLDTTWHVVGATMVRMVMIMMTDPFRSLDAAFISNISTEERHCIC